MWRPISVLVDATNFRIAISQRYFAPTEPDGDGIIDGCLIFRKGLQAVCVTLTENTFRKELIHMTLKDAHYIISIICSLVTLGYVLAK